MNACAASAARVLSDPSAPPPSSTTAERPAREHVGGCLLLELPEGCLAVPLEDLRDGLADSLLDDLVDRDERPAQALGEQRAERRLPRAHEADEREVPV